MDMGTDMGVGMGMGMGDQGSPSNSSNSSMSMSSMDMSMDPTCKMSMLWNWYTIDACFISSQWHIRSKAGFAFSVISVFILVVLIEGVRRFGREYDRKLVRQARKIDSARGSLTKANDLESLPPLAPMFEVTHKQQLIRALIFTVQFGAAYIIMLLVMPSNGFIIFAVFLGGGVGHFVFGRDTVVGTRGNQGTGRHVMLS